MSTFVPSNGAISISQIKAAFPNINSNSLGDYRGVKWFKSDNSRSYFPSGGNAYMSMSAFYGTSGVSPATPGSVTISSSQSWQIPMFNVMTVTVKGGDGGKSGDFGLNGCSNNTPTLSANGYQGGTSNFGPYQLATGGAGGSGNGVFGSPGNTTGFTWDVDANNSYLSHQFETVSVTVGTGGAGGAGGPIYAILNGKCTGLGGASNGSPGANGYVTISWT